MRKRDTIGANIRIDRFRSAARSLPKFVRIVPLVCWISRTYCQAIVAHGTYALRLNIAHQENKNVRRPPVCAWSPGNRAQKSTLPGRINTSLFCWRTLWFRWIRIFNFSPKIPPGTFRNFKFREKNPYKSKIVNLMTFWRRTNWGESKLCSC
jgi:hypothetical protein